MPTAPSKVASIVGSEFGVNSATAQRDVGKRVQGLAEIDVDDRDFGSTAAMTDARDAFSARVKFCTE